MTRFGLPLSISREPTSRFGGGGTPREMPSRFSMSTLSKETVWRVGPPVNNNKEKPGCHARKCEKRIPLKGWDVPPASDDGIETWAKRQAMLESKRGHTKKHPVVLDSEYYISPKNRCSALDDAEHFAKDSLHHVFTPKEEHKKNTRNTVNGKVVLKYKYTHLAQSQDNAHTFGIVTPAGFTKSTEGDITDSLDPGKDEMNTYKHYKITGNNEIYPERRSKSMPESHSKNKTDQKSSNYYKIKQILRLSKFDTHSKSRGINLDEDEDEGYSSKTSSAEAKEGTGSDSEETRTGLNRKSFSMVDLSELPSEKVKGKGDTSLYSDDTKIKFSYTHQNREPSVLRLPDSNVKLGQETLYRLRLGRENSVINGHVREKSEDFTRFGHDNSHVIGITREKSDTFGFGREHSGITGYSYENSHIRRLGNVNTVETLVAKCDTPYRKLHRHKEEAATCSTNCLTPDHVESTTVYNINNVKPVTLVLRKISIQNAEDDIAPRVTSLIPPLEFSDQQDTIHNPRSGSRIGSSRAESRAGSRIGVTGSSVGSSVPRSGSAMSGTSSTRSRVSSATDSCRLRSARQSPRPTHRPVPSQSVRNVKVNKPKEAIWSPSMSHVSVLDRQESNCCIGDLIPAMDKSIYTNQFTRSKPYTCTVSSTDSHTKLSVDNSSEPMEETNTPRDDGYMLLKKGLDLLTGSLSQQSTLGPPPFRPNQSRHPLIQNVTVITDQGRPPQEPYPFYSPVHDGKLKVKTTPRTQSDKGSRHTPMVSEKATQKKLKEAFSKFYQNRPKDIGKEFRRMQTTWNA